MRGFLGGGGGFSFFFFLYPLTHKNLYFCEKVPYPFELFFFFFSFPFFFLKKKKTIKTTVGDGYLGSHIDDERSEMRYLV